VEDCSFSLSQTHSAQAFNKIILVNGVDHSEIASLNAILDPRSTAITVQMYADRKGWDLGDLFAADLDGQTP